MTTKALASLLFVRSSADLSGALAGVNELLARRPEQGSHEDAVLGVLVRRGVDAGLPTLTLGDELLPREGAALRESVGLSGVWSLCAFDLQGLERDASVEQRRRYLLDSLSALCRLDGADAEGERPRLLPVFTPGELLHRVELVVAELAARYPALAVGPERLFQDAARGGALRRARDPAPPRERCHVN